MSSEPSKILTFNVGVVSSEVHLEAKQIQENGQQMVLHHETVFFWENVAMSLRQPATIPNLNGRFTWPIFAKELW